MNTLAERTVKLIEGLDEQIENLEQQNKRYREAIERVRKSLVTANMAYTLNQYYAVNFRLLEALGFIKELEGEE